MSKQISLPSNKVRLYFLIMLRNSAVLQSSNIFVLQGFSRPRTTITNLLHFLNVVAGRQSDMEEF